MIRETNSKTIKGVKIICDECRKPIKEMGGLEMTTPKGVEHFHRGCLKKIIKRLEKSAKKLRLMTKV